MNRHCINCLRLELEHLHLGTFMACPTEMPGEFFTGMEFVAATNLEWLERKATW